MSVLVRVGDFNPPPPVYTYKGASIYQLPRDSAHERYGWCWPIPNSNGRYLWTEDRWFRSDIYEETRMKVLFEFWVDMLEAKFGHDTAKDRPDSDEPGTVEGPASGSVLDEQDPGGGLRQAGGGVHTGEDDSGA